MRDEPIPWASGLLAIVALSSACGAEPSRSPAEPRGSRAAAARLASAAPSEALWLSELGVLDPGAGPEAQRMLEFEPAFTLWSDGATKRRWLWLPDGARIGNTDPDHWSFPVGALLVKEFTVGGRRIETRVVARTGSGARDYFMGAFVWNESGSDALFTPEGLRDAGGTGHDVPSEKQCGTCHNGEPGRVLGFSAVQLPDIPTELLTEPQGAFNTPGTLAERSALGYLHANCGHCHNPRGSARPDTDLDLRLEVSDVDPLLASAAVSTVSRPLQYFRASPGQLRVAPGAPGESALLSRMNERGNTSQMPPLGTEQRDEAGMALVRAWIEGL